MPVWKKVLFGLLLAAAALVLTEGVLSLAGVVPRAALEDPFVGFAATRPLFVERKQADGTVMMETATNKIGLFNRQSFPKTKAPNTVRIFCMGGSTTYGNPYRDSTSFCGWLREMLPVADPSRRWELINAGGISYASYRVTALMEELSGYEPDVFLILSGQNEFLEERSYGAVRELPAPVREVAAHITRTRIYSAMERAVRSSGIVPVSQRYTLDAEVNERLGHTVGPQDYRRDDGQAVQIMRHYEFNLARMAAIGRAAGARVVMVVPPVNMKDVSPFKSEHRSDLTPRELADWSAFDSRARDALRAGAQEPAAEALQAALAIDARYAETHFMLGQVLLGMGKYDQAKQAFQRAIDEDVCPLRILSPMQAAVRSLSAAQDIPLVDAMRIMEDQTRHLAGHRIPGNEMFLDHVHPTIEGNRLLALALLDELRRGGLLRDASSWTQEAQSQVTQTVLGRLNNTDHADAIQHLGRLFGWAGKLDEAHALLLRALDMYGTEHKDTLLLLAMSSERRGKLDESIAYFKRIDAHSDVARLYQRLGRMDDALRAYAQAVAAKPEDTNTRTQHALLLTQLERLDEAERELTEVLRLDPQSLQARGELANVHMRQQRFNDAIREYQALLQHYPDRQEAHFNLGVALASIGRPAESVDHMRRAIALQPDFADARLGLGIALEQVGQIERAIEEYREALRREPRFAEAHNNLGEIFARSGQLDAAIEHFQQALAARPAFEEARVNLARATAKRQGTRPGR
ncbi:tetratricopeptide repeat protein [Noviherbaspirillum denitrificans]|uniref:Tetratricopeptide repeat protein n=1 Tax=Noviherbaspirillum denitrificans TaxID=1968433 RepID=A0A254T738_9BURK|nr:tetratricopeptide repeat protein [Noviherbaspirillum denitrificans]OWW18385.1 hypothetical protein AYR66_01950 [Noviherbaspirillum denitrificans]